MAKYYKVDLSALGEDANYAYCVICTKVPFFSYLFKEIITDKIIYPFELDKSLIYSQSAEIEVEEVEEWLEQMNKNKLQAHVETIKWIETKNLKYYEKMRNEEKKEKAEFKSANKNIKRTLRKIKQR